MLPREGPHVFSSNPREGEFPVDQRRVFRPKMSILKENKLSLNWNEIYGNDLLCGIRNLLCILLLLNKIECLCGTFCCVNNSNLIQLTSSIALIASKIGCICILLNPKSILYAIMYFPVFGSRCWSQIVVIILKNDWWPLICIGIKASASIQLTSISPKVKLVGSAHSQDGRLQPNSSLT